MRVHTFHTPNFDICVDKLDYTKSPHYELGFLKEAYDWLFGLIGTNQVIWCHPIGYKNDPRHGEETKEWILEVPDDKIIKEINVDVWDSVIMDVNLIPDDVYHEWEKELTSIHGNRPTRQQDTDFFDKKEAEWQYLFGTKQEQWERAIFSKTPTDTPEILIPSPVPKEWVIDVRHYSDYNVKFHEHLYGTMFSTKEEAERFIMLIHSFMKNRKLPYTVELTYHEETDKRESRYSVDLNRLWEPADAD